ncbi:UNVERIFIED_CONTAM: hypothetical protein RMT77_009790 [Armadillidium vulgare]
MELHTGSKLSQNPSFYVWTKQGQHIEVHPVQINQSYTCNEVSCNNPLELPSSSNKTSEETEKYRCDECGKCFSVKSRFLGHKKVHTGEKPYQCGVCDKKFVNARNLLVHSRIHTGDRPYVCHDCGKSFTQRSLLTVHRRTHTGERPFQCEVCGKAFYQKDHLSKHKRTHSGVKPYPCKECGKAFSDNSTLRQHIKRHLENGHFVCVCCKEVFDKKYVYELHMMAHKGLKPEECEICGRQFPTKGLLGSHKRCHFMEKVFTCDICDKDFYRVVTLKKHLKYYHGFHTYGKGVANFDDKSKNNKDNKPFKCNECDMTFTNNGKFLIHQKKHQSLQQFKCNICGMTFAKSYTLEVHQQMHSTDSTSLTHSNQTITSTVTVPIVTLPVVNSIPTFESSDCKESMQNYHSIPTSLAISPNDGVNLVKIVSLRPIEDSDRKNEASFDPLAMATAAAHLGPSEVTENFTLFDQPTYTYYIPTQMTTTITETE